MDVTQKYSRTWGRKKSFILAKKSLSVIVVIESVIIIVIGGLSIEFLICGL